MWISVPHVQIFVRFARMLHRVPLVILVINLTQRQRPVNQLCVKLKSTYREMNAFNVVATVILVTQILSVRFVQLILVFNQMVLA